MRDRWRTIWYFSSRGFGYGGGMGLIAGTLVVPVSGSAAGAVWGAVVGFLIGILLGIGVDRFNQHAQDQQMDFEAYQATLTTWVGLITTIIAAVPLFIIFAPVAGLAAATISHRYAEENAFAVIKRKNDLVSEEFADAVERPGVIGAFSGMMLRRAKWLIAGMTGLGFPAILVMLLNSETIFGTPRMMLGVPSLSLLAVILTLSMGITLTLFIGLFGLANGIMLQMMNRVVFAPDLTREQYKKRVTIFAGVFTLFISAAVTFVVGAPVAALVAIFAARDYADWYYDGGKKKKREFTRLEASDDASFAALQDLEDEHPGTLDLYDRELIR